MTHSADYDASQGRGPMSGFIDPSAPHDRRIERLELLMTEVLKEWDTVVLSPEARSELESLMSGDEGRRHRALRESHRRMTADPMPEHNHDDECDWDLCPFRTRPIPPVVGHDG